MPSGDSVDYTWEEPLKPHKLTLRVGAQHKKASKEKPRVVRKALPFNLIETEDQAGFGAPRTLRLDEIGFVDSLPCPMRTDIDIDDNTNEHAFSFLHCHISAVGKKKS